MLPAWKKSKRKKSKQTDRHKGRKGKSGKWENGCNGRKTKRKKLNEGIGERTNEWMNEERTMNEEIEREREILSSWNFQVWNLTKTPF